MPVKAYTIWIHSSKHTLQRLLDSSNIHWEYQTLIFWLFYDHVIGKHFHLVIKEPNGSPFVDIDGIELLVIR